MTTRFGDTVAIAHHAAIVLVGQLAVMAFGVTDTVVASRHSEHALAALSVGTAIYISVYVGLMGMLQALLPIWAELHGGRRAAQVGASFRQALYVCAATIVVGMAILFAPDPILKAAAIPPALEGDVREYLKVLAWALPPALLFRLYSTLSQSIGLPRLVTALQLVALLPKIGLSIWFTFGGAGIAPQGVAGCAWATLVVNYGLLCLSAWLLRSQGLYAAYDIWRRIEPPNWPQIARFLRLGVPAGLAVMVEVTSFTLMALFVARLGTLAAASHQIAANLAAVLYMMPLAIGIATSARVSYWLGGGRADHARRATGVGLLMTALLAVLMSAALIALQVPLIRAYAKEPALQMAAGALMTWVALYHLGDAIQAVSLFVLRSYGITVVPLLAYCVVLWGVGLTGGYWLAFHGLWDWPAHPSPSAFWIASSAALATVSVLFLILLASVTKRR